MLTAGPSRLAQSTDIPQETGTPVPGWRPSTSTVVAAGVAVAGLLIGLRPIHDNSFLTHLATGRLLLGGTFPHHDPYSFTAQHVPWVVESWLPSLLYAIAERVLGAGGLVLLQGGLSVLLALLVWRLTRPARTLVTRELIMIVFLVMSITLWSPRPLMFGLLALGVTIVLAQDDRLPAWWLAPVGWIWVNSHGSWPLGLGYLALRLVGQQLDRADATRAKRLLGWAVLGACLGAVGPVGPSLLVFPLHVLSRHAVMSHVLEWQSPSFASLPNLLFLAFALGTLLLARRGGWQDAIPCAVFVVLALMAMRNMSAASLVLCPVLARHVPAIRTSGSESAAPRVALTALASLTVLAILATGSALARPAYRLQSYPVAELSWMRANGLLSTRIAAPDFVGNYRTWSEGAHGEVFIDDRYDMYPPSVSNAEDILAAGLPGWDTDLDRYQIGAVLWRRQTALAELLRRDPRWAVVHDTSGWVVAVRRAS